VFQRFESAELNRYQCPLSAVSGLRVRSLRAVSTALEPAGSKRVRKVLEGVSAAATCPGRSRQV